MALTEQQQNWLSLVLVPGVGTTHFVRLLARFGAPDAVLGASEHALEEVVGPKLAQRIRNYRGAVDEESQVRAMERYGVRLITLEDPEYPPRLAEIYDPPLVLFCRGELHDADTYCVSIVGTRKATPYGLRMAEQLGRELAARGITVVSGMALGIDAAAHRGALSVNGRTVAVLGNGVDTVFPSENADLMHQIIQHGAVLSSFPMGMKPLRGNFPQRNRFISGLSLGTLVVEAAPGSGALITARHAAEQGREVFALPGQVGNRNSLGPHSLIREGAKLVETVEDLVVELDLPAAARRPIPAPAPIAVPSERNAIPSPMRPASPSMPVPPPRAAAPTPAVSEVEKDVLAMLSPDGSFVDEVAMACRIPVSEALSSLTLLEIKGLVRQFSGKRFAPR
jgi:DNA processing protein